MLSQIKKDLQELANPQKAKVLARFFKTGRGEYGEGDVFLGITVPEVRQVARKHSNLSLSEIRKLLQSPIHEERLASLLILVEKYDVSAAAAKKEIFDFYIANAKRVNNWDLVDLSAHRIVGRQLIKHGKKEKSILQKLAKSENLWERRITIVATYEFIRNKQFDYTFKISQMLLNDRHDLIHKATGWMLREVGKRDQEAEEKFLRKCFRQMPRTMLRYAIERFSQDKRRSYLRK